MELNAAQSGHWHSASRPEDGDGEGTGITPTLAERSSFVAETDPTCETEETPEEAPAEENAPAIVDESAETRSSPSRTVESTIPYSPSKALVHDGDMPDDNDDERFDPAWGLSRSNTEHFLSSANRSTSFPPFISSTPDRESVPTQIEDDMSRPSGIEQYYGAMPSLSGNPSQPELQPRPEETSSQMDQGMDGVIGQSNLENPMADLEDPSNARYEEGVPLMSPDDTDAPHEGQKILKEAPTRSVAFVDEEEETSFFNHITETPEEKSILPSLERKSTSAVLAGVVVKHPQDTEPFLAPHDAREDAFAGGGNSEDQTAYASMVAGTMEPDEKARPDDVWKAMMDEDDEFLVDDPDDLLPDTDSEPGSPSSFDAILQDHGAQEPAIVASPTRTDSYNSQRTSPRANRPGFPQRQSSSNPFAPHQPSTSELSQLSPTTHSSLGFSRAGLGPLNSFQSHPPQRPALPQAAGSFADQSKGGYKSPYDLPMELSKPRRRAQVPQLVQTTKAVPPPPRSSSMTERQLQSPFTPNAPELPHASVAPPSQIPRQGARSVTASIPPSTRPKPKASTSSFFEELPMTSKPRPVSGQGRYTPQQTNVPPVPQLLPQSSPQQKALPPQPQPSPPRQADPYAHFQLRQPERLDPFSNIPIQPPSAPTAPTPAITRYSPAPPTVTNLPRTGPSPRYSPAPPPQSSVSPALNRYASQPQVPQAGQQQQPTANRYVSQPPSSQPPPSQLPFAPRTSSPLVHHKASIDEGSMQAHAAPSRVPTQQQPYQAQITSPPTTTMYVAQNNVPAPPAAVAPPRRSQTQSPSKQRQGPTIPMPSFDAMNRPASAHGQMSPIRAYAQMETALPSRPSIQARALAEELEFIQPSDETIADPLQRWKGAPVFHFGFGGTIVTTFPKHIPRYTQGSSRPQLKATVGEISSRNLKDVLVLPEAVSSFPGPLRNKSQKKDALSWLHSSIARLESEASLVSSIHQTLPDPRKRHEEKILLWRVLRALVEHNGVLDTTPDAMKSVNAILAPEVHAVDEATATQYRAQDVSSGIYRPSGASAKLDAVDPMALETLRKHLLRGGRQEAVWHAVDHRLWSHALLIASTLPPEVWSQVIHEFVKQEVRTAGANVESLSTLYEIFGGNKDDCIDQLVPPSARAGLHMVSKVDQSGPTKNALDGLDRWRETLTLVINNRTQGDHQALANLGRLLSDYGRIEAAHICFMFSRSPTNPSIFGGPDDPQASLTLLGADSKNQPYDLACDHEAILLTEVYEFATLILGGSSATPFLPYLSPYKLQRAVLLAEQGYKSEAQAYCDALMSSINKSTKTLPYYHRIFLGELDDFQNRLKQVPIQASGSWGKPNLEKVSNSILGRLSSFVAGDDSDAESRGSAKEAAETGPFANVAGTPSLSRTGSQTDIHGSYPSTSLPNIPSTLAGSRYAPNGISSARSSSELTRGRPSLDSQRSPPQSSHARSPYEPTYMMQQAQVSSAANPYQSFGASPPTNRYQATPPQTSYMPNSTLQESSAPPQVPILQESYIPTPPPEQQPQQETYGTQQAVLSDFVPAPYEQPSYEAFVPSNQPEAPDLAALGPHSQSYGYGYEPPSDSGYVPYTPEPDSPEEPRSKKKSFKGDDDSPMPRPSNPTPSTAAAGPSPYAPSASSRNTGPDPAIVAAAEAEAKAAAEKDAAAKAAKKSSGWFGGIWGGKKNESLDASPANKGGAEPKVYKAKLGESKMKLYFDKDLNKWVNPDNPDAGAKTATPPPPRSMSAMGGLGGPSGPPMGGLPRAVSAMGQPPMVPPMTSSPMPPPPPVSSPMPPPGFSPMPGSGPPSRQATPANSAAPLSATLPPNIQAGLGVSAQSSGPPSRPGTAMSNASSIDDLLGAGPPGGGRKSIKGKKGGKGGRYVDVMAK